jgi:prepilin-type N-terminal cleavage/methylation domain-containing protein
MKKSSQAILSRRLGGFSLIELLTVLTIIAILAGLTIAAFSGVQRTALRNRARNEVQAIGSALESYKADNGSYPTPPAAIFTSTNVYTTASPNSPLPSGIYEGSSAFLYEALTGRTNYSDPPATAGTHVYYPFNPRQLGNNSAAAGEPIYIRDPFGNSYGYFNGYFGGATPALPYNGTNQYDLWSTAGDTGGTNMPGWVTDWGN